MKATLPYWWVAFFIDQFLGLVLKETTRKIAQRVIIHLPKPGQGGLIAIMHCSGIIPSWAYPPGVKTNRALAI